jgi:CRP-like cAMP-binding protein
MAQTLTNLLLDEYTRQAGPAILSRFEPVPLPFKTNLFRTGERPRYVNFMTSGLSSLIALLDEGIAVEVAMIGHEGCAEAVQLLGPELPPRDCMMQVPGSALRMPMPEFTKLFEEDPLMRRLVLRLVQYQSLISNQLIACNGQHDAVERLARWLLMVQDRIRDSDLPLTQEFLSEMLGARRSTVTISASSLQRAGLIEYRRGHIRIIDRDGLTDTACECYGVIRKLYDNLYKDQSAFG